MKLNNLLAQKKIAIVKKWFSLVIETYPPDTSNFLKRQKDPFANPVGRTIWRGLETLFDELLAEMNVETITAVLDPIVRIRAVQNFTPSQAICFIFSLKQAVRENLKKESVEKEISDKLILLESRVDDLALMAFNLYMQCREQIYEIKANEMKNSTFRAFERAGLVSEIPENAPVFEPINHFSKEASNDT
jgi:RsbT co-antagonist protein rsbRD N-terminal domain